MTQPNIPHYTHTQIFIYTYIYSCLFVCMCVFVLVCGVGFDYIDYISHTKATFHPKRKYIKKCCPQYDVKFSQLLMLQYLICLFGSFGFIAYRSL